MKILLVSPLPPTLGGISVFARNLTDYLASNPCGVKVIFCNTADKLRSVVNKSLLLRLVTGSIVSIRIYLKFIKIIRNEIPQLVHLSSSASLSLIRDNLILSFANRSKIPVITHWHFGRIPEIASRQNWEWKLLCSAIKKSRCSIVIDNKSYNTLIASGFSNVLCLPIPLGPDFEKKTKKTINKENQNSRGKVIFVGHIIRAKGIFELVNACSNIHEINELILIGPYKKKIKSKIFKTVARKSNSEWLKFTGALNRDRLIDIMLTSGILALPSYTEGFPNVILEAMATGCCVVATDVGAIPDMLAIGENSPCGICVPVQDTKKLEKAISYLINNPESAEMMGANGMKRIKDNYTSEIVISQYLSVWSKYANT